MKPTCFVGFDTSNYTTSAAVCTSDGKIIANLKRPLPVKPGECGLRQSDAVFAHVKNLPVIASELREILSNYDVLAVGYSARPRNQEGSYMPCFLSGRVAAESFASALNVPIYDFSHQDGHVTAAAYSSGAMEDLMRAPFAAFHVSGGTTEMLYVEPTDDALGISLVGQTADLNAGQAIDRVGVMMGLQFPCGKEMEGWADSYSGSLPHFRVSVKNGICNLSGLQNLAEKLWREEADMAKTSAFVFSFLGETLKKMTAYLDEQYGSLPIVYAGGVMSNRFLQTRLGQRPNTFFAEPQFSADNAAGIALLCRKRFLRMNEH